MSWIWPESVGESSSCSLWDITHFDSWIQCDHLGMIHIARQERTESYPLSHSKSNLTIFRQLPRHLFHDGSNTIFRTSSSTRGLWIILMSSVTPTLTNGPVDPFFRIPTRPLRHWFSRRAFCVSSVVILPFRSGITTPWAGYPVLRPWDCSLRGVSM